ncbi:hypothetical protein B2J93_5436 [Marssonina coronariae]|uniref:Major facilitator superfamily (MFS) profile domain-containing protein n=1 Tax=Diplocarpon coronariae TaxID=2795749 RepID=A0A218YZ33_9HELO|nr:hypothetical protein B2J93_5436 [Marssonina coronariae]
MDYSASFSGDSPPSPRYILAFLALSLAYCQRGFSTASISNFQAMLGFLSVNGHRDPRTRTGWDMGTTAQQLAASFLNLGAIFGVLCTLPLSRYVGLRHGIWLGYAIVILGAGLQLQISSVAGLYARRILMGLANGLFMTLAHLYTAECAPAHLRGEITPLYGICVCLGNLLGATTNTFTERSHDRRASRAPLCRIEAEQLRASRSQHLDMFRAPDRRRTLVCFAVVLSNSSPGVWLVLSYGTAFLQISGVKRPFPASVFDAVANVAGTSTGAFFLTQRMRRRAMMLLGHFIPGLCMLGLAMVSTAEPKAAAAGKAAAVAFVSLHRFFYHTFSLAASGLLCYDLLYVPPPIPLERNPLRPGDIWRQVLTVAGLVAFTIPYIININELN